MRTYRGINYPSTYEELCSLWEDYHKVNGKYPNSVLCAEETSLPSWSSVKYICGNKFEEFKIKYRNEVDKKKYKPELYDEYCQKIIAISEKINKTPTVYELKEYDETIPDYRWFIINSPAEDIKDYNSLMTHIGLKPNYFVTREMATNIILSKFKQQNGKLKKEDFSNPNKEEISISVIKRIWGSFNKMLNDLELPINQLGTDELRKSTDELELDIKRLCEYKYKENGHKHICLDDIRNCEWCSSVGTYGKQFKKEFNMTLCEYISYIGYIPNGSGMGMIYNFENGETTTSKFEYSFSKFLRENNINYSRNIRYDSFADNYKGNKDCDYIININERLYYIEVAGMIRDGKSIEHAQTLNLHYIQQKYLKDLIEKEKMLQESKVKYYILFPRQINDEDFLIELIHNLEKAS